MPNKYLKNGEKILFCEKQTEHWEWLYNWKTWFCFFSWIILLISAMKMIHHVCKQLTVMLNFLTVCVPAINHYRKDGYIPDIPICVFAKYRYSPNNGASWQGNN